MKALIHTSYEYRRVWLDHACSTSTSDSSHPAEAIHPSGRQKELRRTCFIRRPLGNPRFCSCKIRHCQPNERSSVCKSFYTGTTYSMRTQRIIVMSHVHQFFQKSKSRETGLSCPSLTPIQHAYLFFFLIVRARVCVYVYA